MANPTMPDVFKLSSDYLDRRAVLDPVWATSAGISGHDGEMTDYSPDGVAALVDLARDTKTALLAAPAEADHVRIARDVLIADIDRETAAFDAGDWQADLNIIASPLQAMREVFESMADATTHDWELRRQRLDAIPAAVDGYRRTLSLGLTHGHIAARRQAIECAKQCDSRAPQLVTDVVGEPPADIVGPALRAELDKASRRAAAAYASLGTWLRNTYAPQAPTDDGVGAERYAREVPRYLGTSIEPAETYRWGLDQVREIRAHMNAVADEVAPGIGLAGVVNLLETDPARSLQGEPALVEFLQAHLDRMVSVLDGTHFDIAPQGRHVEQMIAPPGGAAAQYYTAPTEDWSRPGRCWFPANGRTVFPIWCEITTANHEGVPGHHLQVVASMSAGGRLSRYQKLLFMSGPGEGWALYAERLCFELGLLDRPDYVLGWLSGQMLRAVRVVVDIGMHCGAELGLRVPDDSPAASGEPWNAATGLAYAKAHIGESSVDLASEIDRYLGWPGQAISYKVGEREWLGAREDARSALGAKFELKRFHTVALGLGAMGLDQLRSEIVRALTR